MEEKFDSETFSDFRRVTVWDVPEDGILNYSMRFSIVSTTDELLERKSSGSCLQNREYGRRDQSQ
jgi:hypothetical protein